jgi:hypothetical protein
LFRIRICRSAYPDPDPAIYLNAAPDPGFAITLEVKILHFFFPYFELLILNLTNYPEKKTSLKSYR